MCKLKLLMSLAILFLELFATNVFGDANQDPIATFEGGYLYKMGNIKAVSLYGSYHDMGREYGQLLHNDLRNFYNEIIKLTVYERKIPISTLNQIANDLFQKYPQRFKEILYGMSETSGLSLKQHLIINAFEYYIYDSAFSKEALNATKNKCSAIASWGNYTKDGAMLFGRNYDFGIDITRFKKFITITAFNPVGSGNSVALVTFAGTLNATTDVNNKGIFLELNSASNSASNLHFYNRIPAPINLFAIMTDASDLSQINAEFNSINSDSSFVINVADQNTAYSYEWPPLGVKKIETKTPGLLVSTNNFTDPTWGTYKPDDDTDLTLTRRSNLIKLANRHAGKIDITVMQDILDTPIDQGGSTFYVMDKHEIYTGFQTIAANENSTIWIKIPNFQNWVSIDLHTLFNPRV